MVEYHVIFTKDAQQDSLKLTAAHLKDNCEKLLSILAINPFQIPPPYEKLTGNFKGCYSRRINIKHRLVYEVMKEDKTVKVLRMWSHYAK